jgi:hypothetical protein
VEEPSQAAPKRRRAPADGGFLAMKASLVPGASGRATIRIDAARAIGFMSREARMDATPMLVRDMDTAARRFLPGHLATKSGKAGRGKEEQE